MCDITQNGFEWYVENAINNQKWYTTPYKYKKLYWPHHKTNQEYKKIIGERYFSILNQTNIFAVFLHMTATIILEKHLIKLDDILKNQFRINYKIVAAISSGKEKYTKINENIDMYECDPPMPFVNNRMNDHVYYNALFKKLIPYNLDKLKLI